MMLVHESRVCLLSDMSSTIEDGAAVGPQEFSEALESAKVTYIVYFEHEVPLDYANNIT